MPPTPGELATRFRVPRVNRSLRRRGVEGLSCTLAYALFVFPDHTLQVANSGLPHPLRFRAGPADDVTLMVVKVL